MTEQDITERLRAEAEFARGCYGIDTLPDLALEAADTIESLRAELAQRDARLAYAKWAADAVLAPICAEIGRSLYQWRDCPNLIAEAHEYGVVVSAADFANLYDATNWDDVKGAPSADAIEAGAYRETTND